MRIQHNIMAMSAYRNYTNNVSAMKKNLEKLSSGYKINRAGDDAAGLAISEKMRAQITGLETAQKNAKDGISLVQTAEGALTEVHDMLNRMVELATQSANGTYDNTTDRAQMQKEVNQLLSEIDRIADSSNFNGINLLDGSLGLNKDAFQFSDAAAVAAVTGAIDMTGKVAAQTDAAPAWHSETANVAAKTPKATIDLGDLKVKVAGKADATASDVSATVDFTIAGNNYSVTLTNSTTNEKEFTTAEIAAALAAKLKNATASDGATVTNSADAMKIGDATFTVTDKSDGTLELTYAGTKTDGTTYKAETTFSGNAAAATAINGNLGFDVKMTGVTGGTKTAGTDVVHKATKVDHAQAETPATKAGIDVKLNDLVKDGYTLTIDGKTFTFKTKTSNTATGAGVIDVSAYAEADQVHAAADLLSKEAAFAGKDNRQWKIGVNGDGTTIHIEQTTASAANKALDSYEKVKGVVSAIGTPAAAKNVGTNITIDQSKITDGNTLDIDGTKYVFTKSLTGKTDTDDTKYVQYTEGGSDAAANLKAKIGAAAEVNGSVVTVRAAAADKPAPTILGKGLTLQIGDTADSFNQLNVKVQDMHSKSLGIGKLDISTEEAAQAATDKIKNAINVVSDVRGTLGATQNRLDHTINNLSVMTENIQDAESTIRDVDVAEEMMAYTKNNILIQSAQAMLAQANQVPQGVLQLLQ